MRTMTLVVLCFVGAWMGCDKSGECVEACKKAYQSTVDSCAQVPEGEAKTTCTKGADDVKAQCETACKR